MYAYHLAPIDYGWEFLSTFEEMVAKTAKYDAELFLREVDAHNIEGTLGYRKNLYDAFIKARQAAASVGWKGDFREYPRVIALPEPGGCEMVFAFVWKQDNNGSTFIISPVEMPVYQKHSMI